MSEGNNIAIQNLSYEREVDNKNLLSGELEKTFNLPPHFLLVSSACKQSLTRFGHRVCNACCASLFASLQANKCVTCGKIAFSKQFYPRPLLARRGKEKEVIIRDCHVALLLSMTAILFPFSAYSTCTPTPDCASIGYTETSCETKSVKCPFDTSKLFCIPCDSSFQYDCLGDNIASGVGDSCGRKYVSCTCSSTDYIFSNGSCLCDTACKVGAIYYSDGSCSACLHNDKNPVGVVVKDNELVVSIASVVMTWSSNQVDMSALSNIYDASTAQSDYSGKSNTNYIVSNYGANASSNASVYCYNYAPTGMASSKGQWYLPAFGEIYTYIAQQYNQIEPTFANKLNSTIGHYFWSSTEVSYGYAWAVQGSTGSNYHGDKTIGHSVNCYLNIK